MVDIDILQVLLSKQLSSCDLLHHLAFFGYLDLPLPEVKLGYEKLVPQVEICTNVNLDHYTCISV